MFLILVAVVRNYMCKILENAQLNVVPQSKTRTKLPQFRDINAVPLKWNVTAAPDAPAPQLRHHSMYFSTLCDIDMVEDVVGEDEGLQRRSTVIGVDQPSRGNLWHR